MTELSITSEYLVQQLMAPINRLLGDVNKALDTEVATTEELSEDNTGTSLNTGSGRLSDSEPEKTSSISLHPHHNKAQDQEAVSVQDKNQHAASFSINSESVKDADSPVKRGNEHTNIPVRHVSPPSSGVPHNGTDTEIYEHDTAEIIDASDTGNNSSIPKQKLTLPETMNADAVEHDLITSKHISSTPKISSHSDSLPSPLLAAATPKQSSINLTAHTANIPPPIRPQATKTDGNHFDAAEINNTQRTYSYHELVNKINATSVVLSKRIPLRPRASKTAIALDDLAHVNTVDSNEETPFNKVDGLEPSSKMTTVTPRSIQRQSQRLSQGIDPVLQSAHHLTNEALSPESSADDIDMPTGRVQNTFNVNVSMNQDDASANSQREILQDTLLDMLRTSARRQGLDI